MKCPKCPTENPEMMKFCREYRAKLLQVCLGNAIITVAFNPDDSGGKPV